VSLRSAIYVLSRFNPDPPWTHNRIAAVYDEARDERAVQSRRDAFRLAQIRSGHCRAFRAYHHLMDSSIDPMCSNCGQAAHTVEHWLLDCSALTQARIDILGHHDPSLDVLVNNNNNNNSSSSISNSKSYYRYLTPPFSSTKKPDPGSFSSIISCNQIRRDIKLTFCSVSERVMNVL